MQDYPHVSVPFVNCSPCADDKKRSIFCSTGRAQRGLIQTPFGLA
jgi:hypothetical protein